MRRIAIAVPALGLLAACGYVGPVVPPSPELPAPITDLAVIEQGDQLHIAFSTPARTTDNLAIKQFHDVDLRIGPAPAPFDFDRWSASAKRYPVEAPEPNDPDDPRPRAIERTIPAADWSGQHIAVAVRTSVKKTGHYSPWSNVVRLDVVPPVAAPTLKLEPSAQGVRISWSAAAAGAHYEVYRQAPADKQPVHLGTAEKPEYLDAAAQYDTPYRYSVVAVNQGAESPASQPAEITLVDIYPPSVPSGVAALATPDSIELSWQRSPEPDLKGYYLYRSADNGAYTRIGDLLTLPTYSDRAAEHGKTYRYQVSAVDQKGNESARSAAAEVAF